MPLFRLNDIQFSPPLSRDRKEAIQTQSDGSYFTAHVLLDNKASLLPIISDGPLGSMSVPGCPYSLFNSLTLYTIKDVFYPTVECGFEVCDLQR